MTVVHKVLLNFSYGFLDVLAVGMKIKLGDTKNVYGKKI